MANQHILLSFSQAELEQLIRDCIKSELQNHINPVPSNKTEFISRKRTAALLGISLVSLGQYCKRGLLPSYRIGCRVLFIEKEVIEAVSRVKTFKHRKGDDL